ncbi:hypothetical protein H9P43_000510 [Blastocladiella emersonii ATCC 22665]|nr:hypothetical protein H9P43_000510 [Blastocladiella emersonii ATCC 22665]
MTTNQRTAYDESRRLAQADRRATERKRVEADKTAAAAAANARYLAPETADDLVTNPRITMISPDDNKRCTCGFREARKDKTTRAGHACIVTGMMFIGADMVRVAIDDFPWAAMDRVLQFPSDIPDALKQQDEIADLPCPDGMELTSFALSRHGMVRDADGKIIAGYLCRDAYDTLAKIKEELKSSRASSKGKKLRPPKDALADYFLIGSFEVLDSLSVFERLAIALTYVSGVISVVSGGAGQALRSHFLLWDGSEGPIFGGVLPNVANLRDFQVIITTPLSDKQRVAHKRHIECNVDKVVAAVRLLLKHYHLYKKFVTELSDENCAALKQRAAMAEVDVTEFKDDELRELLKQSDRVQRNAC